jgi:hypothetical protein
VTSIDSTRIGSLADIDGDVDLVLLVVQFDVEGAHARVGKPTVAVERLDSFEIGLEGAAIEVSLAAPWDPGAPFRLQRIRQRPFVDLRDAVE